MPHINETWANSADPDQTPLAEATDRGLFCLRKKTGHFSVKVNKKYKVHIYQTRHLPSNGFCCVSEWKSAGLLIPRSRVRIPGGGNVFTRKRDSIAKSLT